MILAGIIPPNYPRKFQNFRLRRAELREISDQKLHLVTSISQNFRRRLAVPLLKFKHPRKFQNLWKIPTEILHLKSQGTNPGPGHIPRTAKSRHRPKYSHPGPVPVPGQKPNPGARCAKRTTLAWAGHERSASALSPPQAKNFGLGAQSVPLTWARHERSEYA